MAGRPSPAVVVSSDPANRAAVRHGQGVVTVCPITSNIARVHAFEVRVDASGSSHFEVDSKIQANQVRPVDIAYIGDRIGDLTPS